MAVSDNNIRPLQSKGMHFESQNTLSQDYLVQLLTSASFSKKTNHFYCLFTHSKVTFVYGISVGDWI